VFALLPTESSVVRPSEEISGLPGKAVYNNKSGSGRIIEGMAEQAI
jgi:hypothetical protein